MTEFIRSWLMGLICASMILAVLRALMPGKDSRILRLAGGLVLLAVAITPVAAVDMSDLTQLAGIYEQAAEDYTEELLAQNQILYETIIEEQIAAYILDKAAELEMDCRVTITVAWEESGIPKPHSAVLRGTWSEKQKAALASYIEDELGIPIAMQYYKERENED